MSEQLTQTKTPAPKAAALVAAHIRKQIVMGELAEGDLLPAETDMLKQLSVSRPTLRQAFRILEAEHLITVQRGSRGGTVVHRPSGKLASRYLGDLLQYRRTTLGDVHRARLMIEPAAIAQLARRGDAEAITELQDLVAVQRKAIPGEEARTAAESFHIRMVELSGNATLAEYAKLVHYLIRAHVRPNDSAWRQNEAPRGDSFVDAHDRLVQLLDAGAEHAAVTHWREHLNAVRDLLAGKCDMDAVLDLTE
ncbi:FadR/GntR family transcriptional regulator [Rhodococcus koreensis]